jgi:hypothetical protein
VFGNLQRNPFGMNVYRLFIILGFIYTCIAAFPGDSYRNWSLEKAVAILSDSSWARQETFTRVIGGIGSGLQGEKEIYDTYFVRLLSAQPIREAFARVQQIQSGYDGLPAESKKAIDQKIQTSIDLNVSDWIVIALSFRSNDPRQESRIKRFFLSETTETIKSRAFLSTESYPKLPIHAYFPPKETSVGAKFVFPRVIDGRSVVSKKDETFAFELDTPGSGPQLRAVFSVPSMIIDGELQL